MSKQAGRMSQSANDFLQPNAVTSLSATDVGTSRPYNDGSAVLTWTLPAGSPAATSYDVTTTPSTTTTNVTTTGATITGLSSATDYTFTVVAKNAAGSSTPTTSSSVTITTVPQAPTGMTATANGSSSIDNISWSAVTGSATGGKAITNYHWESNDSKSGDTTSTSASVSQEAGTAQQYRVYATNANGNSEWSSYSSQVTTFSFTPFAFTPFAFTPYNFTPYNFTPYNFTPVYSFTPYNFTPYSFVPYSFAPYAFAPLKVCIDQDTLIQLVGDNDSVIFKKASEITVGDKIWSIHWEGLQDESIDPHAEAVYPGSLNDIKKVYSEIIAIDPSVKDTTLYFNGDKGKRFTAEEKVLVKRGGSHMFVEAKTITTSDFIFEATETGMVETPVLSVDYIDETRNVFKFNAFPVDTIIAGNMVVHNSKIL